MARRKKNNWMIFALAIIGLFLLLKGTTIFQGALISQSLYNGDMENWCIQSTTETETGYGFLNGGKTKCTDANSAPVLASTYNGIDKTNEIPTMWKLKYGCCTLRSTDAYEGQYATQIHKENTNDWFGFGMTKPDEKKFMISAIGGRTYTLSVMYKYVSITGRNPSMTLLFFDANGNEITSAKQGGTFSPTNTYTKLELTGEAPLNAKYVGWYIWFPVETISDLWLDDLKIDESDPCSPVGSVGQCGTDLGVCSYGTRTCQTDGNWGQCTGGISSIPEICGNGLDDDCDGLEDEYCTFEGYTKQELITKFDTINTATYQTTGFSSKNHPTWWAWDNAPIVEAQLNMYLATKDQKYLDMVAANTDVLISKAGDGNNDGLKDWQNLESPIDPILTYSRTLLPMVKFAYIVKKEGITKYETKADQYLAFVENNFIPVYDGLWKECGTMGYWAEGARSAPNNRASFVGRIYLYLWLITDEPQYYDKSVKYANKIKSTLRTRTDGPTSTPFYFWNYKNIAGCITLDDGSLVCTEQCAIDDHSICPNGGWICTGPLELSYGNYDVMLMLDYYEAKIVFNADDVSKIAGTFKEGLLLEDATVNGVRMPVLDWSAAPSGPTTEPKYYITGGAHHWARLGKYDSKVDAVMKQIIQYTVSYSEQTGDWYSKPYLCVDDLRDSNGEVCHSGKGDDTRTTPAYQMSALAHLAMGRESLTTLNPHTCEPSWTCTEYGAWSIADESCGIRTRTCTDTNNCGITTGQPTLLEYKECAGSTCGNGVLEKGEACDGDYLIGGKTCKDMLPLGTFVSGTLKCSANCGGYDTSLCVPAEQKGGIIVVQEDSTILNILYVVAIGIAIYLAYKHLWKKKGTRR